MRNNTVTETTITLELPHETYPVEWWFFQGFYVDPDRTQFEFMLTIFRTDVSHQNEAKQNGYSIIISLLNRKTGKNYTVSRIDSAVLENILKRFNNVDETELDKDLAKIIIRELEKHGPPRPIELSKEKVETKFTPFEINWGDVNLKHDGEVFSLDFSLPKINHVFSLVMKPLSSRIELDISEDNSLLNGEMFYVTYPQMELTGFVNEQAINGTAWFDHQWGNTAWFITNENDKRILGWDWCGINLSDGTNIIVFIQKLMKTNEIVFSHAFVFKDSEKINKYRKIISKQIRYWESPHTHIQYPIEWQIEIPELGLELVFEPYADDQELQILGIGRAIWEGAGRVKGTLKGKPISGRARAEFFGYGYIFDFQNYVKTLTDRIDKRILEYFPQKFDEELIDKFVGKAVWKHEPEAYTEMLSVPIWDLLTRKGKRWRPIFGILLLEALGKSSENYEASACLSELVHSGALIIDDIEDNSLLRRGEECLHLKYGLDVALNAGNTLYFLPSVELLNHKYLDNYKKLRIHEVMMNTYLQAHFGQTVDIYWSKKLTENNLNLWMNDSFEDKILQMYDYKTAAGAKGLAEVASVIAEVNDEIKQTCIEFARTFAVAFQIIDDVHNFSDSPRWTKTCGEDLANGKITFAIVKAIKLLEGQKSKRLIEILCSSDLRKNREVVLEGIDIVRNSGALDQCREIAKKISSEGNEKFSNIIPSCQPKIMLSMLCSKMLDLAFDS